MHSFETETNYGRVKATWQRSGRMIEVRYGERTKRAQAGASDASSEFVARDIVRGWIADDLKEED